MQFVAKPDRFSQDVIIPGRISDPRGFVSTGVALEGLRGPLPIYLSAEGIRLAAQRYHQLGLIDSEVYDDLAAAFAEQTAEREKLEAERDELRAQLDRISGLKKDGFQVARVQGRPKQKVEAKA